jgi:hypothetical protein
MGASRKSVVWPAVASLACLVVTAFSLLWAISSFSLSFADCQGAHSLSASNFRCQRPVLLQLAFLGFLGAFLGFGAMAVIRWYRNRRAPRLGA